MLCFLLLFSFYILPVLVTEALGEDVMLEFTASYAWQCQRPATPLAVDLTTHSPSLPRARHAEADFSADAHQGMLSCGFILDFAPFTLSHLPLPLLPDSFVFTLSTQKLSARNSKHTMTKTTSPPPLLALICLFNPIPPPAVVWTLGCFCGDFVS